jgi:hypothetical protein
MIREKHMAEALLAQAQQLIKHLSLVDQDDPWQEFFKAGDALGSNNRKR